MDGTPAAFDEYYLAALRRITVMKRDVRVAEQRALAIREQARRKGVPHARLRDLERAAAGETG